MPSLLTGYQRGPGQLTGLEISAIDNVGQFAAKDETAAKTLDLQCLFFVCAGVEPAIVATCGPFGTIFHAVDLSRYAEIWLL